MNRCVQKGQFGLGFEKTEDQVRKMPNFRFKLFEYYVNAETMNSSKCDPNRESGSKIALSSIWTRI